MAVGNGPQALVRQYPGMKDLVFTCGKDSLGNPGHCNALWTFLMPFSRFFSHYSGQIYKISGEMPEVGADKEVISKFCQDIIQKMLKREFYWIICNALSLCAFTFIIFSQEGKGYELRDDDLLPNLLNKYGIQLTTSELKEFARTFWAQSINLKNKFWWQPQNANQFPERVYEALGLNLNRPIEDMKSLMENLIDEWKKQTANILQDYELPVNW